MATTLHPLGLVGLSTATYGALLATARRWTGWDATTCLDTITDLHSVLSCSAVLIALSQGWPVRPNNGISPPNLSTMGALNDTQNPLIHGISKLGNAITAWEAGYLLYDSFAVAVLKHRVTGRDSLATALTRFARKEPLTFFHHAALLTALLTLQAYIAQGKERGIWIVVTFHLMNASTPLLHWKRRQKRVSSSFRFGIDIVFAAVFAACRMGLITWVLQQYGHFHDIGPWEAFCKQRWFCKVGTGLLLGVNSAWWLMLVRGIIRKTGKGRDVKK